LVTLVGMGAVCPIRVDRFESKAVVAELARREVPFEVVRLAVADYVLPGGELVERKDVRDLHLSIRVGRFWRQIGLLTASGRPAFLVIEGPLLDAGSLHPNAVRGACLSVADLGVSVIRSEGPHDTVTWLAVLAARGSRVARDRPLYAQRIRSRVRPAEAVLAAIPGISTVVARRLLDRYGTVAGVVSSDPEEWIRIRGVGAVTAEKLRSALF
jgi:ERCC4-type nuclease